MRALLEHLREGRSAFLVGEAGIGKTAILRAVAARAQRARDPRRPIYCGHGSTLKASLISMARQLLLSEAPQVAMSEEALGRLSVGNLKRLVLPRLRSGRYALLLDHFGLVRGAYATFLEDLTRRVKVPVVFAVRSLDPRESGRLWWIAVGHATVEVPPLRFSEARRLIERCLEESRVHLPDRRDFISGLLREAHGIPGIVTRICEMAVDARYQIAGRTDLRLLFLDLTIHNVRDHIEAEAQIPLRGPVPLSGRVC